MIPTPDLAAKIALWRRKAAEDTLTIEEMAEAIALLRGGRVSAQVASDTSRAKRAAASAPIDANSLLDDL